MKRYFLFFFLVLSSVLVFGGCAKKELSPQEAQGLLSKNPPGKLTRVIHKHPPADSIDPGEKETIEKMQAKGYLILQEGSDKAANGAPHHFEVAMTGKLSPFVVKEEADTITFKLADIVIDKVTAVTLKDDEADIAYTTKLVTNQLADEVFGPLNNPSPGPNHANFRWAGSRWK